MARFARLDVYATMLKDGLVPLFHRSERASARLIAEGLARGGARVIEFTDRGDGALAVFTDLLAFLAEAHPQVILGVGSIEDAGIAGAYLAQGANFVVGPTFDEGVARTCHKRKVAYLPGCATATEVATAEAAGVEIVKIFPGFVGGPAWLEAIRAPRPWTSALVSGGVSLDVAALRPWFAAGAACVGAGSGLVPAGAEADPAALEARTRTALDHVAQARVAVR